MDGGTPLFEGGCLTLYESSHGISVRLSILVALGVVVIGSLPTSVSAGTVLQDTVYFGLPRTQVVSGLDFEAACRVSVAYEGISMLDEEAAGSFLSAGPGPCSISVYILGVQVQLPILNPTPLGRFSFMIPGVGGITFGLAEVSVDLLTSLFANYTGSLATVTPSPMTVTWNRWGSAALSFTAHSGAEGNTLSLDVPYTLSMGFAVGVSVYFLGARIFSADLASLGSIAGTPVVRLPAQIDVKPTHVSVVSATATSAHSLMINWSANSDSDFGSYRIRVDDGRSPPLTILVEDPRSTTLTVPAVPSTDYTVSILVVDRAGQPSSTSPSASATTPQPPPSPSGPISQELNPVSLVIGFAALLAGIALGFVAGWGVRGRRKAGKP